MKKSQQGYGIIEYLLGAGVLIGILFVPVKNNKSLSKILIDAVKTEHAAYIHVSSMTNVDAVLNKLKTKKKN